MATSKKPYIVLIDDDVSDENALIDFLQMAYGLSQVKLFQDPNEGVAFIKAHLAERVIVLLDIMFDGKAVGFDVFEEITSQSVLVCCIVMTGSIETTAPADLQKLINGHAWYLTPRDAPAKEILKLVRDAEDHLAMRVDGALEEWVLRQAEADQKKPFITSKDGKVYSLIDILRAIRTEDDTIAKMLVRSITTTAIELLSRDKSRIGN